MMHADVSPALVEVAPGEKCSLKVRVTNSTATIDAYRVSLFGLDPAWVQVDKPRLSLFPSESGDVELAIDLPTSFPAGHRQLSVHVRSENDPASFALTPLELFALGQPRLSLRVDPVMIQGGREANFGLVVTNEGNTTVDALATATDPEEKLEFALTPDVMQLPRGHQEVVQARVRGSRPWVGQPKVRVITFAVESTTRVEAIATFLQRPRISRWVLSLMGLLAAAAVFAVVLSRTFDTVVDEAAVDKETLSAALDDEGAAGQLVDVDAVTLTGKVVLFSDPSQGVTGVQAELFGTGNTKVSLATAATGDGGTYTFRVNTGNYKIKLSGAGFNPVWYVDGETAADATEIPAQQGTEAPRLKQVALGGRPGTIKGTVEAADLTGITATLLVPGTATPTPAEVQTVKVSADGSFIFENVPSPVTYQLVVQKTGYATETRTVALGPAQTVDNIEIVMRQGDGSISGHVATAAGPLGGATIEATDGTNAISTVSLTDTDVGSFALRSLVTPQVYTLTVSREGYKTETRTISVGLGQPAEAGTITLSKATGSLSGHVIEQGLGPIGGVTVTVNTADTTVATVTASTGDVGSFFIDELPLPATYTITFVKQGLVSQVRVQDLDPVNSPDAIAIDVALIRDTATVGGTVRTVDGALAPGATVVLSDGTTSRQLVSANDPPGAFAFSDVKPGTYTLTATLPGTTQAVVLVNVVSDETPALDVRLQAQASVNGQVLVRNANTAAFEPYVGATVRLFLPGEFPNISATTPTLTTDANGMYHFVAVNAPQNYVVAVYQSTSNPAALDSQLILTQPSVALTVPTFQITVPSS